MILSTLLAMAVSGPIQIHTDRPGVVVNPAPLGGFPLNIWNDSSLFRILKPGMREAGAHLFRFPDGDLSNEYHWNGTGQWDADSVWVPSDTLWSPGFMGESRHRGTSKNLYGFQRPSLICDGNTSSYWWSQPDHPDAPGWFYVDFGSHKPVDSLALWLGTLRPDSVQILKWTGLDDLYPGPHMQFTGWVEIARIPVSAQSGVRVSASLRYLAVRPIGTPAQGWQVREFLAYNVGNPVTSNVANQPNQTQVVAISAHSSIIRRTDYSSNWDYDAFANWIAGYPGADPLICVNYGNGTPQEAAAWVHHANRSRHDRIRRWEVGNEMAGPWEDGGPVNARQYAIRFLKYSKAMKAVDSSISVYGPVWGSSFLQDASGNFDGLPFTIGFLRVVDSAERRDGKRYLDGIDFHTYPYWFATTPDRAAMLKAIDENGLQFDTLLLLMANEISSPLTREIVMSEYNTSTLNTSVNREASAGTASGLLLAHFIQRFGNRGAASLWALYGDGSRGPDGTFGSPSAFNRPGRQAYSNLAYPPNGTFWPLRTLLREWLDTAGGDTIVPIDQPPGLRLFAVSNHGRISVMAFNLGKDTTTVAIDPSRFANGDLLSWGTGEYLSHGTGLDGYANPGNGPSSKPVPPGWTGSINVPPFGFVVARGPGRTSARRNVYVFAERNTLSASDTVKMSGWSVADGATLTGGRWWVSPGIGGALHSTDGAWDGPTESWTASIRASVIGTGSWKMHVAVAVGNTDTLRDSFALNIEGALRPVLLVSNFDANSQVTAFGKAWYLAAGDTGTHSTASLRNTGGFTVPYLHVATTITQGAQAYLNFQSTIFETSVPAIRDPSKDFAGLSFDYRADLAGTGQTLRISVESSPVKDYNYHALSLPATGSFWVNKVVRLSDLQQADWGKPTFPVVPDSINHVVFRIDGVGPATLDLDEVYLLGTKGSLTSGTHGNPSRIQPAMAVHARNLVIHADGNWKLKLIGADGRISLLRTGRGDAEIQLPKVTGTQWALLESSAGRRTLALPPVVSR